jgi:hypothetical protein
MQQKLDLIWEVIQQQLDLLDPPEDDPGSANDQETSGTGWF